MLCLESSQFNKLHHHCASTFTCAVGSSYTYSLDRLIGLLSLFTYVHSRRDDVPASDQTSEGYCSLHRLLLFALEASTALVSTLKGVASSISEHTGTVALLPSEVEKKTQLFMHWCEGEPIKMQLHSRVLARSVWNRPTFLPTFQEEIYLVVYW